MARPAWANSIRRARDASDQGRRHVSAINLIQADEPLRIQRIVLYPYPDLTRLWYRLQLEALQDQPPNISICIWNPDQTENASIAYVAYDDAFLEATIHLRQPVPAAEYVCTTEIATGMRPDLRVHDFARFRFPLEFRDAAQGAEGFGYERAGPPL